MKYFPSNILKPILCTVTNFFSQAVESIMSTGLSDQKLAKGRPNSAFERGRIKCNLGSGEKYIRLCLPMRQICLIGK